MIRYLGTINVPEALVQHADKIKLENYTVNKPSRAQVKHSLGSYMRFDEALATMLGLQDKRGRLNFVYFSCCKGAEPHTDEALKGKFEDETWVIPVILPKGRSVMFCEGVSIPVHKGGVYHFDHTKTHGMTLEDTESGCVVVMVAVKK